MSEVQPSCALAFQSPWRVILGCILAGPFSPMLLLFGLGWMAGISVATAYWAALTISLPASIGVLVALIYLSRRDRLTEATIVRAMGFGVLAAVAIYFVWYLVTLYAGADAHTTLIEKLVMPLGVLGPVAIVGLCWGSFTAAASYVPFRYIAFKRVR